ncbi:hypothetical protein CPB83DRAFT_911162 [Crepidotus variabilis]|uniref:phosphatidylinositol-3,4,5-trisphosphate 3-phosphatase n=1 Tax=Crepidotus variabilis TaxID=179855 RepID=A0A9P6E556_9AGAR|nr:hypothetical protein CPB83DRAFT_911162 [Crepidotus variabilis]
MTDFVRRLVSGNKARFKDDELDLELDLVYVTDQIIIMGYPAAGMEGLYRNRREDAIRFLEHRHGNNFWVFNFCPIKENSYESSIFGGRVSRYPFPDHHAPPLAIMPLVAREIDAWLNGSSERVAVLHCKAGKGRSGTMACTYLLAHNKASPPQLQRNYSKKDWAKQRMEKTVESVPPDDDPQNPLETTKVSDIDGLAKDSAVAKAPEASKASFTDSLKGVLDLHTARRMKPASDKETDNSKELKVKQGVSIPSQRRFLYYWALLLSHDAPKHIWAVERVKEPSLKIAPFIKSDAPKPKIRLTQLKLRMRETSSMKLGIVRAANKVIEKTGMAKGPNAPSPDGKDREKKDGEKYPSPRSSQVWVSLARYDDRLVDLLEEWEVYTRDETGNMAKRRPESEHLRRGESTEEEVLKEIFSSGKWDKGKMVRSFARLGISGTTGEEKVVDEKEGKIHVYTLTPLSDKRWEGLKHDLSKNDGNDKHDLEKTLEAIDQNATAAGVSRSEANSMYDVTTAGLKGSPNAIGQGSLEQGVVLDAGREIRVKLYMGQVFMGWTWFIPTFHMPQPPPASPSDSSTPPKSTLKLTRADIDFPLGLGSSIIDLEIEMEWIVPQPSPLPQANGDVQGLEVVEPPVRARTEDSKIGTEAEPESTGLAAVVHAATTPEAAGEVLESVVKGKQADDAA